jgi:hypothetical protein
MFKTIVNFLFSGLSFAWFVLLLGGLITMLTAPSLFGFVLVTAGALATLKLAVAIAFGVGGLLGAGAHYLRRRLTGHKFEQV